MKRYMAHILVSAEKITEHFLKVQVHDEGTLADGGMEGLVVDVKPTVFALRAAMSVYLYPQSRFYKDETLRTAMEQAIDFVARNQNEDGSFDYTVCNFHSAPDTAFCYHPMDKTYRLMKKFENDVDTSSLQEKYLADPKSGPCPCFKVGDTFLLKRTPQQDDFYHLYEWKILWRSMGCY